MSWGPGFMYYQCSQCKKRFKYELGALAELGDRFGRCPVCGIEGMLVKDGPRFPDDCEYEEIDTD